MEEQKQVTILYTNWRGETRERNILPISLEFKSTQWHPEPQWILDAIDLEKQEPRGFAVRHIKEWR